MTASEGPGRAVLLAWTSPVPGRSEEFADWLRTVHIPEICAAMPAVERAHLHRTVDPGGAEQPPRFLVQYELDDDDVAGAAAGLAAALAGGRVSPSPLMDTSTRPPSVEWYVRDSATSDTYARGTRTGEPRTRDTQTRDTHTEA